MIDKFLQSVAKWYFDHKKDDNQTYWVFPNRRSCIYFELYFKETCKTGNIKKPVWHPKTLTINELIAEFSQIPLAEPLELLAILYKVYQRHSGSMETFDQFFKWGEMILTDFNDIDKYHAQPDQIFLNLKGINEMKDKLQYLTEEQIEVIQRFFSSLLPIESSELKKNFLEIWEVLLPVYNDFTNELKNKNIAYEGYQYKMALQQIVNMAPESLPFNSIHFVGFNAITPIEEKLFEHLKTKSKAHFFWDYDNMYLIEPTMEAGHFIRNHLQKFPEPVDFKIERNLLGSKTIHIISSSTDSGQLFKASQYLTKIPPSEISNTALVLSDEALLLEAIHTMPETVFDINITMGFPYTASLTWSFLTLVIQLQLNSTESEKNGFMFYFKHVLQILRHPFIQRMDSPSSNAYIHKINQENIVQVTPNLFSGNSFFETLFTPVNNPNDFKEYVKKCFSKFQSTVWNGFQQDDLIEKEFAIRTYATLVQLNDQMIRHQLFLTFHTFLVFLRQHLKNNKIAFEGEPVTGLQLMGFLETRNIDFKNVMIISASEGILPASNHFSSFIPYSLRRGFGLPTRELHDAMYAFYFYRLLQRCDQCYLFYNSGLKGLASEDKSRYIYQLMFNPNFKVNLITDNSPIEVSKKHTIQIEKDQNIQTTLKKYSEPESGYKLSPSALSAYVTCPLRFYFRTVANIHEPDEVEEQVDARIFGTIFHLVAEKFYRYFLENNLQVSSEKLDNQFKNNPLILKWINDAFNETLKGKNYSSEFIFEGKNLIVSEIIYNYLKQLIQIDKNFSPFTIRGIEQKVETVFNIPLNGTVLSVKIGGTIDRMDKNEKGLRIIDYKTGTDKLQFNDMDQLFQQEAAKEVKAVFQTFIYCLIISKINPEERVLIPSVYQIKDFYTENTNFQVVSNKYLPFKSGNFVDIRDEFLERFIALLKEIFDPSVPFTQTGELKNCEYCPYKHLCKR